MVKKTAVAEPSPRDQYAKACAVLDAAQERLTGVADELPLASLAAIQARIDTVKDQLAQVQAGIARAATLIDFAGVSPALAAKANVYLYSGVGLAAKGAAALMMATAWKTHKDIDIATGQAQSDTMRQTLGGAHFALLGGLFDLVDERTRH